MEPTSTQIPIIEQVKQYLETKIKLLKYEGIDKASGIIAEVVTDLVVVVLSLLTFLFFSITLALFAAHLLNSAWEGFGCVTLLYLIILIAARTMKISLQNIFIRIFIRKVFKNK
jgi:hypothetical protein